MENNKQKSEVVVLAAAVAYDGHDLAYAGSDPWCTNTNAYQCE